MLMQLMSTTSDRNVQTISEFTQAYNIAKIESVLLELA